MSKYIKPTKDIYGIYDKNYPYGDSTDLSTWDEDKDKIIKEVLKNLERLGYNLGEDNDTDS